MFCTHCGSEIEPGAKFCTNCGAPVEEVQEPVFEEPVFEEPVQEEKPAYEEAAQEEAAYEEPVKEEKPEQHKPSGLDELSEHLMVGNWNETFLWIMGLIPLLNILGIGSLIPFVFGIILVILDYKELQKRNGVKLATWVVVLGALFNIVYLIARPHGTSKNYKPLILFIVCCVIAGFLRG